jgi:hypothetical protein
MPLSLGFFISCTWSISSLSKNVEPGSFMIDLKELESCFFNPSLIFSSLSLQLIKHLGEVVSDALNLALVSLE